MTARAGDVIITWSPDGERIAFTAHGVRDGLYVTPRSGRYVNLVAATADRAFRNADAFDRFSLRIARTYFSAPSAASRATVWRDVTERLRCHE